MISWLWWHFMNFIGFRRVLYLPIRNNKALRDQIESLRAQVGKLEIERDMYKAANDLNNERVTKLTEERDAWTNSTTGIAKERGYKQAIIEGLMNRHIYTAAHEADAWKALNDLICYEIEGSHEPN